MGYDKPSVTNGWLYPTPYTQYPVFKAAWQKFKNRRPGSRFHGMYTERKKKSTAPWKRVASIAGGIVVLIVGLIALPMPGPGMLIVAVGAGLIARESEWLSKKLDRFEVFARRKWREIRPAKPA